MKYLPGDAGRHHVLELPAEQAAVEVDGGLGVGLAGVDPARDAGDVSVSLGHLHAPFGRLTWPHPTGDLGQDLSSIFGTMKSS